MSRGGGRGGRGGWGAKKATPWPEDPTLKVDYGPAEAFPPYDVSIQAPISDREKSQVRSFLLFREQVHDGPFYTATRSWTKTTTSGSTTPRAYGQAQINQRYGVKTKATVDPFTAVEMPHSHQRRPERALPDFGDRPFNESLFPPELHATLDGEDGGRASKRRKTTKKTMTLSKVTALRTAEEIFNMPDGDKEAERLRALEKLDQLEEAGDDDFDLDDEEAYEEEDQIYDDEDGGDDYGENYFDNGDEEDYGYGGDDGGGGDEPTY